ncbi:Cerato-platanin-domain-containing protein [Cubamyces lactineus]|nr:Cerato-platanin-domain-containing protein [Cubamyces lactineus]
MQFSSFTTLIVAAAALATGAAATPVAATTATVTWDSAYDNTNASVSTVSCSGFMERRGFTTFGLLSNFPYIGGAGVIDSYDSSWCGTCWKLTYNGKSINLLAFDHAGDGFNISEEAMNELTDGEGIVAGHVDVQVEQLTSTQCGI